MSGKPGRSGRPKKRPLPTALKLLAGNPGKRPLNLREPQFAAADIACPEWLGPYAREEWQRVAPELKRTGVLTVADLAALEAYCLAYQTMRTCEERLAKDGLFLRKPYGRVQRHPLVTVAAHARQQVVSLGYEFGLTPSARTKLVAPDAKPAATLQEFVTHRRA